MREKLPFRRMLGPLPGSVDTVEMGSGDISGKAKDMWVSGSLRDLCCYGDRRETEDTGHTC